MLLKVQDRTLNSAYFDNVQQLRRLYQMLSIGRSHCIQFHLQWEFHRQVLTLQNTSCLRFSTDDIHKKNDSLQGRRSLQLQLSHYLHQRRFFLSSLQEVSSLSSPEAALS